MQHLFESFEADLDDVVKAIKAIDAASCLPEKKIPEVRNNCPDDYCDYVKTLNQQLIDARNGWVKVPGVFKLYIAGLFESYVKTLVEEMAVATAKECKGYKGLPKPLREALIKDTAKVIPNPRKYGLGDDAVESFIKNLHKNIHEDDLTAINHQCVSITESNMRPEILSELFKKLSITAVWVEVGGQATIKTHFHTSDSRTAQKEVQTYLEEFMRQRNEIAHSSTSISWPPSSSIINDVNYFKVLGKVLLDICVMSLSSMKTTSNPKQNN